MSGFGPLLRQAELNTHVCACGQHALGTLLRDGLGLMAGGFWDRAEA
jgi:hypothetical protein